MERKGLVVIYDPHALYQFLMYYSMQRETMVAWDALCLPKEGGKEEMQEICSRTGIFEHVFFGNIEYASLSASKKMKMFIEMFGYAVTFRRKECCRRTLNTYISDIEKYDVLVGNTELGLITGMLASFADKKKVIYFEDGMADYWMKRKGYKLGYPWYSAMNIEGFLMSKLGYCCKGGHTFRLTKYCYKFASNVMLLSNRDYKEIDEFVLDNEQNTNFKTLLEKTYPQMKNMTIANNSAILFTDPPSDIYADENDCVAFNNACVEQIDGKYDIVYLKKHPRDASKYNFKQTQQVIEIDRDIPSECILPLLKGAECFFTDLSSTIIAFKTYNLKPIIFIDEKRSLKKTKLKTIDGKVIEDMCNRLVGDNYEIRSVL